ncbi:MAG: hypothetical protein ACPG7F_04545 [Aggregatilineales bacterium]
MSIRAVTRQYPPHPPYDPIGGHLLSYRCKSLEFLMQNARDYGGIVTVTTIPGNLVFKGLNMCFLLLNHFSQFKTDVNQLLFI